MGKIKLKKGKGGRKKLPPGERRVLVYIYPRKSAVQKCGGMAKAKKLALDAIEAGSDYPFIL